MPLPSRTARGFPWVAYDPTHEIRGMIIPHVVVGMLDDVRDLRAQDSQSRFLLGSIQHPFRGVLLR